MSVYVAGKINCAKFKKGKDITLSNPVAFQDAGSGNIFPYFISNPGLGYRNVDDTLPELCWKFEYAVPLYITYTDPQS